MPSAHTLTQPEQRIAVAATRRSAQLVDDLKRWVAIPTGFNHRAGLDALRGHITSRLEALGATITLVPGDPKPLWLSQGEAGGESDFVPPPTAICKRASTTPGNARVLLCGHLDTVHDPSGPFRELITSTDGTRATGPGCADMKGGIAVALHALEILHELGIDLAWTFVLNSDEETGSYASDRALRAAAPGHDVGLVFEPALPDGSLVIERPGSAQFMIECRGRAAHVGRDFASGISAVNELARQVLNVAALPDASRGIVASIGPIHGGHATNVVPDHARAWGNARFPTEQIGTEIAAKVDAMATPPGALPSTTVHRSMNRPAKPTTPRVEQLALMARDAAAALGQQLPFGKTGGVCDGNNLQAAGLPVIDTLGVRGGGLHTPQEWIELASLTQRCALAAVLMSRLHERGLH
jgi:glutamate carboxypeptidase